MIKENLNNAQIAIRFNKSCFLTIGLEESFLGWFD